MHSVQVVRNKSGWFINHFVNGSPARSHGPLEGPLTVAQAFAYLAATLSMEN